MNHGTHIFLTLSMASPHNLQGTRAHPASLVGGGKDGCIELSALSKPRSKAIAALCNWVLAQLKISDGRGLLEGKAISAAVDLLRFEMEEAKMAATDSAVAAAAALRRHECWSHTVAEMEDVIKRGKHELEQVSESNHEDGARLLCLEGVTIFATLHQEGDNGVPYVYPFLCVEPKLLWSLVSCACCSPQKSCRDPAEWARRQPRLADCVGSS
eukprot:SAG31_NODE_4917_length_2868_cov_2.969664_2_plen_213_part_00